MSLKLRWMSCWQALSKASLLFLIFFYRIFLSGLLGGSCRFQPSCSQYAVEVAKTHSFFGAIRLIFLRIVKCRPGGPFGYDPPPSNKAGLEMISQEPKSEDSINKYSISRINFKTLES